MSKWNFVGKEAAQEGKSGALQEFVQNRGSVSTEDGLEPPQLCMGSIKDGQCEWSVDRGQGLQRIKDAGFII